MFYFFEQQFEKRFNGEKIKRKTYVDKKDDRLMSVKLTLNTLEEAIFSYIYVNVNGCRCFFEDPEQDKKGKEFKLNEIN